MSATVFHGDIVYAKTPTELFVQENGYLIVENGTVQGVYTQLPEVFRSLPIKDYGRALIIPAFTDLHIHASQFLQRGLGMDCLLFDWLNTYTFPQESNFRSEEYAQAVYSQAVRALLRHGTFHACLFTTIHQSASNILFQIMEQAGMYGFVGKVNMDRNAPDYLCETTEESLRETEQFVSEHSGSGRVKPILTPRFAPTCSERLLKGLGRISKKYGCGIQTHLVESREEARFALQLFPNCHSDAEIYENAGLLGNGPSIFAHVIFPTDSDKEIMRQAGSIAVHCPEATVNITAGIMPVAALRQEGFPIAIGTDIGSGQAPGIYRQIAKAVQLSKLKEFYEPGHRRISFAEAFYMGTVEGGKCFGKVGSFDEGYQFNALVLDHLEDEGFALSAADRLERFCYAGDDRNIIARFIDGKEIIL